MCIICKFSGIPQILYLANTLNQTGCPYCALGLILDQPRKTKALFWKYGDLSDSKKVRTRPGIVLVNMLRLYDFFSLPISQP